MSMEGVLISLAAVTKYYRLVAYKHQKFIFHSLQARVQNQVTSMVEFS